MSAGRWTKEPKCLRCGETEPEAFKSVSWQCCKACLDLQSKAIRYNVTVPEFVEIRKQARARRNARAEARASRDQRLQQYLDMAREDR